MAYFFSGAVVTGTSEIDLFVMDSSFLNNEIYTMNSADLVIADFYTVGSGETGHDSIANASSIFNTSTWHQGENPLVADGSIASFTYAAQTSVAGQQDYYAINLAAGENAVFDIDGGSFNTVIKLFDANGTELASNTNASLALGGLGSSVTSDSYLEFTAGFTGTYFLRVGEFGMNPTLEIGDNYLLTISGDMHMGQDLILSGNDTIYNIHGYDIIYGMGGDDQIYGGFRSYGGDGDDIFYQESAAAGHVYGGDGINTLDMTGAIYSGTLTFDLTANEYSALGGGFGVIRDLVDIEIVYGSIASENEFTGNSAANFFSAGDEDDIMDGGAGIDTISYQFSSFGVTVDLGMNSLQQTLGSGVDGIFNFENLHGSQFGDTLTGSSGNNGLNGLGGDDTISGGAGVDIIAGGLGADILDGGAGFDTLDFRDAASRVAFSIDSGGTVGEATGDTYAGFEVIYGSAFNDSISGSNANEFLYGEAGNDTINAGDGIDRVYGGDGNDVQRGDAGNDVLYGSAGSDQLNGGIGFDVANYTLATSAVSVNMASGGTLGDAAGDTYFGVEAVYGSVFDDALTGNNSTNELRGGDGDDSLNGAGGNDRLFGGAGADAFNGGTGIDIVNYALVAEAVHLSLATGGTSGEAAGDTYSNVEWVFGSDFDDTITGDNAGNRLEGRNGDDIIDGGGGNDRIQGGLGSDTIMGGDGVDTIFGQDGDDNMNGGNGNDFFYSGEGSDIHNGGPGIDSVSYLPASAGVTLHMDNGGTTGDATDDTYIDIERIFGSGFDDNITGSFENDVLLGNGGDDYLAGGNGNDVLNGGAGIDSFGYDETADGADIIQGFTPNELIFLLGANPNFDTWAEVQAAGTDSGTDVVFDFGGGNTLTIFGQNLTDLDAGNFDFSGTPPASEVALSKDLDDLAQALSPDSDQAASMRTFTLPVSFDTNAFDDIPYAEDDGGSIFG